MADFRALVSPLPVTLLLIEPRMTGWLQMVISGFFSLNSCIMPKAIPPTTANAITEVIMRLRRIFFRLSLAAASRRAFFSSRTRRRSASAVSMAGVSSGRFSNLTP